ncbi:MAG: response regulator, partial [Gemmatimonadales bacterium]
MPQTLLVIDDEPQIRRVVRNAFKDGGTRILEAATGAAGIDLAAAERPDLIILDLGLPD